jgi:site-specific DNA-methyltransferase (adenine-specific)
MLDLRNMNCMDLMAQYPDKHFELAIVDPPYGIGYSELVGIKKEEHGFKKRKSSQWDKEIPTNEYFKDLFRVSKNQIIWGGNYFPLPTTRCFIIWDKVQRIDQADCEFAWTSFEKSARIFSYARGNESGFAPCLKGVAKDFANIHPCQKPVALYKWLLHNYAKQGDKILDTHLGSGSIAIACHQMGYELTGSELDKDYFEAMQKRIKYETAQEDLFL